MQCYIHRGTPLLDVASLVGLRQKNPRNSPIKSIQFPAQSRVRPLAMKARDDIANTPPTARISVSDRSQNIIGM